MRKYLIAVLAIIAEAIISAKTAEVALERQRQYRQNINTQGCLYH
jgi:hypothetical protein